MHSDTPQRPGGPVPLSALLDEAERRLRPSPAAGHTADGFLFSGNRHDSVPRALLLDRRLTPLERNAWQVLRLLLNEDSVTAFPTYEQLRPYLASMPCAHQASHETVARALTVLRLTRWLSLVRRRRDRRTGRILGNLYVLHDEPLSPFETMQLDPDYLSLVSQALTHAAKAVRLVGAHTLKDITDDPLLSGRTLPTRLQVMVDRLASQAGDRHESYPQGGPDRESEEGQASFLRNREAPSSESETPSSESETRCHDSALRNPKKDRTVRINNSIKIRTVPRARDNLRLPPRFHALKHEQQMGALAALRQVEDERQQAVLDEWDARCRRSTVRNPAGYLFGIIQKAIKGEFHAWAGAGLDSASANPPVSRREVDNAPPSPPADPEKAMEHIAHLHALFRDT